MRPFLDMKKIHFLTYTIRARMFVSIEFYTIQNFHILNFEIFHSEEIFIGKQVSQVFLLFFFVTTYPPPPHTHTHIRQQQNKDRSWNIV
jgi:hypothetical protein